MTEPGDQREWHLDTDARLHPHKTQPLLRLQGQYRSRRFPAHILQIARGGAPDLAGEVRHGEDKAGRLDGHPDRGPGHADEALQGPVDLDPLLQVRTLHLPASSVNEIDISSMHFKQQDWSL